MSGRREAAPAKAARAERSPAIARTERSPAKAVHAERSRSEVTRAERSRGASTLSSGLPGHFVELPVEGYSPAVVWVPAGAARRPLFTVTHGAGGGPEAHCEFWSQVVAEAAFLLCLRGLPLDRSGSGYYYPEHHTLDRIWTAALAAFDARFPDQGVAEYGVYIGYSQGATMGSWLLPQRTDRFPRALLVEGGFGEWNVARAREYAASGGQALFIACGTQSCNRGAKRTVEWFTRTGLPARTAFAAGAGHTPGGEVGVLAAEGLNWLLSQ